MKNNSVFQLHIQSDLSTSDFKVLSLLYQPLIGMQSYALYTTFYQMIHQFNLAEYTHQMVFDLLDLKQTDFLKIRNKLEALNLIESYQLDDTYIYLLKTPLSAKQFLTDTVLGSYLQSEIGENNLEFLIKMFKKEVPDINSYRNISKSFDDVYEVKQLNLLKVDHDLEGRVQNKGLLIEYNFDYRGFLELLPDRLKSSALMNQRFQETIEKIAFVYEFDVKDMVEVYQKASLSKQNVNYQMLNFKAKQYFEEKDKTLTIKEKSSSEIESIEKAKPYDIIKKFAKLDQQGIALSTVSNLLERNQVEPGIIYVIMILVLKHKDGVMPHINYLEKVLNDWLNKGIRTTEDAVEYASKLENSYDHKKTKTINKTAEPDWMDEYVKKIAEMEE